jgi:hypothetical protein
LIYAFCFARAGGGAGTALRFGLGRLVIFLKKGRFVILALAFDGGRENLKGRKILQEKKF